ncbi:carbohydrate kinase family protein [Candidatus Chloroploca sp. M-50]|uniref:Carbohydrate kinase family protein n=1 Tax=Candidatus Chloroploca mongolica TaxID=2528176 RepID=A0ABS4DGS8_9CHLR|nr:carbohydrate kinase family protein [Candidatus Chloroploca mongolica]MBP1468640.1 carbohydrate kinase family protein [Candidatus Chloroploca mongolica]
MKEFDVYAYGVIASSELHLLSMAFPSPDSYAEIVASHFMTGGEALNSAIVLSRLGVSVQLDGNWIGATSAGERLLATIARYGIDTQRLRVEPGFAGVREMVFSDERSRTIFGNYVDLLSTTRKWNIPRKDDLAKARLVCVDPPFQAESALVGAYAVELGVPFVSIDCPYDQALASTAAAVIISGEFRNRAYPQVALAELFDAYQQRAQGLVVFTVGDEAILYGRKGAPGKQLKPYAVNVIDSAGAGDSFRAGVIYGMLQQWSDDQTIQYAAAVAGMVCASFPGVLNSPTHAEVMHFMQVHALGQ